MKVPDQSYVHKDLLLVDVVLSTIRFAGEVRHHPPRLICHPSSVMTDGAREVHYTDTVSRILRVIADNSKKRNFESF
jgi:hypothetical protein